MQKTTCDFVIKNATIIDGRGNPSFTGGIAVDREKIIAIGNISNFQPCDEFDALGLIVAPGFIDTHTHDDTAVISNRHMLMKLSQGVTTVITGNCGISLTPINGEKLTYPTPPLDLIGAKENFKFPTIMEYFDELESHPPAVNIATLIGHTSIRLITMNLNPYRAAHADEIITMKKILDLAMQQGAIGLSTGLNYPSAIQSTANEIQEVASVIHQYNGIYTTHMRDESDSIIDSINETIEIARFGKIPTFISHIKAAGINNFGRSTEIINKLLLSDEIIGADMYPYTTASTVLLENWVKLSKEVTIIWSGSEPTAKNKTLKNICNDWNCSVEDVIQRLQPAIAIYDAMDENDMRNFMLCNKVMFGSDGIASGSDLCCIFGHHANNCEILLPNTADEIACHPRLWGTFPRILGKYVRRENLFSLEQAIYKMTALPAKIFGFAKRGEIKVGNYADIVIFDPLSVEDKADLINSRMQSVGIKWVFVNGHMAYDSKNNNTTAFHGQIIKKRSLL